MNRRRWRMFFISALTLLALYSIAPSLIYFSTPKDIRNSAEEMEKRIPSWLPQQHVKLGLDLQGGVQLVLGVNTSSAVDNKLGRLGVEVQRWADDANIGVAKTYELEGKQTLRIELKPEQDVADFKTRFNDEFAGLVQVDRNGQVLDMSYDDDQIKRIRESAIEQAERVVRNRVDKWGVSEPLISRRQADNSILVQLPGFRDPEKAKELLGRTAQLKFKLVDDNFDAFSSVSQSDLPEGITLSDNGGQAALVSEDRDALLAFASKVVPEDKQLLLQREDIAGGQKARFTTFVVDAATEINGDDVLDAFVSQGGSGLDQFPDVAMKFTGPGGKRFGDLTGDNIGRRLAIVLDDIVVSAPTIQSKIATGEGRITLGSGKSYNEVYEEANELALILKSGALPATIEVLEERQVGASLGPQLADEGIRGVVWGTLCILIFLVFYYRRPGVIACMAILLNAVFLLALMAFFGFSLTLPGIAGFVLTLGIGVDANVLINERIRQELGEGRNAKKAVENGFGKVFWTIIDANVTTLIAALVLLETNPSGPIRGFAVTLILGLIVSMFTSLYCSKAFFDFALSKADTDRKVKIWLGGDAAKYRVFSFNFVRLGKPITFTGFALVIAVLGIITVKGMNWGVDFAGGTEMLVSFEQETSADELRTVAQQAGIRGASFQALEGGTTEYLIRFGGEDGTSDTNAARVEATDNFRKSIQSDLAAKSPQVQSVDFVGPQIGKELRNQGIISLVYAIIGIMLYIAFRFDMRFGPSAVVKMVNDLIITIGFYAFFWRTFDLTSVAACLTVVGYSVNDVIVIYDRIRENVVLHPKRTFIDNINVSLNETLGRTIITSLTTVLALVGILIFASGSIWNFAAAMATGVIVATISSMFLGSTFVIWAEKWRRQSNKKASSSRPAAAKA